jgi:hypothetical protein
MTPSIAERYSWTEGRSQDGELASKDMDILSARSPERSRNAGQMSFRGDFLLVRFLCSYKENEHASAAQQRAEKFVLKICD